MKKSIKMKTVIGHPEEIITKLTNLILEGEVNVVLFYDYESIFSPKELEEKLSKSINLNNGWDGEYLYVDDERYGLKFHRQGEDRIEDEDVVEFLNKGEHENLIFPDGMVDQIQVVTKNYVRSILPGLLEEGLTLEDILEDRDSLWDYIVELVGDLDKDVQELVWFYDEKKNFTLWSFTCGVLKTRFVLEMKNHEVE